MVPGLFFVTALNVYAGVFMKNLWHGPNTVQWVRSLATTTAHIGHCQWIIRVRENVLGGAKLN